MTTLAAKLKEAVEQKGLTQGEAADAAGVSVDLFAKYLNGDIPEREGISASIKEFLRPIVNSDEEFAALLPAAGEPPVLNADGTTSDQPQSAPAPSGKRRGRPKGSKNAAKATQGDISSTAAPKRRGRPPGPRKAATASTPKAAASSAGTRAVSPSSINDSIALVLKLLSDPLVQRVASASPDHRRIIELVLK